MAGNWSVGPGTAIYEDASTDNLASTVGSVMLEQASVKAASGGASKATGDKPTLIRNKTPALTIRVTSAPSSPRKRE